MMINPRWTHSRARGLLVVAVLFFAIAQPGAVRGLGLLGLGPNFVNDVDVDVTGTSAEASGTFEFKTGIRLSTGYEIRFPRFVSVEIDSGVLYNDIDSEILPGFEAWYVQVPLLINVVFRYDFDSGWTPFAGAGGGAAVGMFDASFRDSPSTTVDENSVAFVPAWQLLGGLQYRFNDHFALAVIYKFFQTGSPEIDVGDDTFEFSTVHNHFVGLQANFSF